jgi:hypothetical protein
VAKQSGRGFELHGFAWKCWNCCCSVCTGRDCPYPAKMGMYRNRCVRCVKANGKLDRVLDCDFFQNKHTSRRKFKIKRQFNRKGEMEKRLDLIMEKLGVEVPKNK